MNNIPLQFTLKVLDNQMLKPLRILKYVTTKLLAVMGGNMDYGNAIWGKLLYDN